MSKRSLDHSHDSHRKSQVTVNCLYHFLKEEDSDDELSRLDSAFKLPDLTLKIGSKKLYIRQDEFRQISEVFDKMLTSDFREKKNAEINFTGKNYKTFVLFLRVAHPGLQDPFDDENVHEVLPLIDEYLAENARKRADLYLAQAMRKKQDKMDAFTSQELVQNLIEAEKYKLPNFLKVNIAAASKKMFRNLSAIEDFYNVSLETRYQISTQRWKDTDKTVEDANKLCSQMNPARVAKDLGEKMMNNMSKT